MDHPALEGPFSSYLQKRREQTTAAVVVVAVFDAWPLSLRAD